MIHPCFCWIINLPSPSISPVPSGFIKRGNGKPFSSAAFNGKVRLLNGDFQGFKYAITRIKQSFLQFLNSMDPTTIYFPCYISSCRDHPWEPQNMSCFFPNDLHGFIWSNDAFCQLGWYSPNSDLHWSSDLYRFYEWLTSLIFVQYLFLLIFHVWHVIDANNDSTVIMIVLPNNRGESNHHCNSMDWF